MELDRQGLIKQHQLHQLASFTVLFLFHGSISYFSPAIGNTLMFMHWENLGTRLQFIARSKAQFTARFTRLEPRFVARFVARFI